MNTPTERSELPFQREDIVDDKERLQLYSFKVEHLSTLRGIVAADAVAAAAVAAAAADTRSTSSRDRASVTLQAKRLSFLNRSASIEKTSLRTPVRLLLMTDCLGGSCRAGEMTIVPNLFDKEAAETRILKGSCSVAVVAHAAWTLSTDYFSIQTVSIYSSIYWFSCMSLHMSAATGHVLCGSFDRLQHSL